MSWRSDSAGLVLLLSRPADEGELLDDQEQADGRGEERPEEPRDPRP